MNVEDRGNWSTAPSARDCREFLEENPQVARKLVVDKAVLSASRRREAARSKPRDLVKRASALDRLDGGGLARQARPTAQSAIRANEVRDLPGRG